MRELTRILEQKTHGFRTTTISAKLHRGRVLRQHGTADIFGSFDSSSSAAADSEFAQDDSSQFTFCFQQSIFPQFVKSYPDTNLLSRCSTNSRDVVRTAGSGGFENSNASVINGGPLQGDGVAEVVLVNALRRFSSAVCIIANWAPKPPGK